MPRTVSGKRYAQAAFEIARERNELEEWRSSLMKMAQVIQDPKLVALLENPKLPFDFKQRLLEEQLGKINPLAFNLACLLVAKGRLRIAEQVAGEYGRLLDAYYGIEHAQVTTAIPLDSEDKERLSHHLEVITRKKIIADIQASPSILGGIIVKINDRLIDGSIRSKLEALRKRLVEAGI